MKSGDSSKIFPTNAQLWEVVISKNPGIDRPLTPEARAKWVVLCLSMVAGI